jgi:hypothetical protein
MTRSEDKRKEKVAMAKSRDIYRPGVSYVEVMSDREPEEGEPTIGDLIGHMQKIKNDLLIYAALFMSAEFLLIWLICSIVKAG